MAAWFCFGVQLDYSFRLSVPSDVVNRVGNVESSHEIYTVYFVTRFTTVAHTLINRNE